jgi:hypothetical protein
MATITLTNFTFNIVPSVSQNVLVSWRKASDPDVPSSYTNAPNAVVDINGNITTPSPYQITGLPETSIVVKAINNCGGAGTQKLFIICEPVTDLDGDVLGQCPVGYTLSLDGTYCYQIQTQPPNITQSNYCVAPSQNQVYSEFYSRIYNIGFSQSSLSAAFPPSGDIFAQLINNFQWSNTTQQPTQGPMNREGIWTDSNCDGTKDALAINSQVTFAFTFNNNGPARTIYVGIGGDNLFELKVNNSTVALTSGPNVPEHFKIWHIIPVDIISGINYFNFIGTGDGSVNDSLAAVIYDNTNTEIQNATSDSQLNILFKSSQIIGQPIEVATCASGWNLDTSGGVGNYVCKRIIITNPI